MKLIWPHLENKTHIIWDWNGTLLDDTALMVDVIGDILQSHGKKRITLQNYIDLFRFPVKDYYRSLGFDFEKVSFETLSEQFTVGYKAGLVNTQLHRGMKDFLEQIDAAHISQSVLSAAHEVYLEEQLEYFGIRHYFKHVYGLKDFHAKGKLDRGKQLMAETQMPRNSTILIGDTDHDLEVGITLGVEVLILADGHQSYRRLHSKHTRTLESRYSTLD